MTNKHAKSPCCKAVLNRFGGRRRVCPACGKTYSIRPKKRGPKQLRLPTERISKILLSRQPIFKTVFSGRNLSNRAKQDRFKKQLVRWCKKPYWPRIPKGECVLIIDGLWRYFQGKEWTLYVMAIKPTSKDTAYFFDPFLLKGKECAKRWRQAIDTLPKSARSRVKALVSDGFAGSGRLARNSGWVHQRCHFHLLLHLNNCRGKRKKSWSKESAREQIYQTIREILVCPKESRVKKLVKRVSALSLDQGCPVRLRFVINDTLQNLSAYRAYLDNPQLCLPHTTNTMEAMNSLLSKLTSSINAPDSWLLWAKAFIRAKKKLKCQGAKFQQK